MKKLNLKLGDAKSLLSKEQMKKVTGGTYFGDGRCFNDAECSGASMCRSCGYGSGYCAPSWDMNYGSGCW